jgi:lysophospholipase L1-like esterase
MIYGGFDPRFLLVVLAIYVPGPPGAALAEDRQDRNHTTAQCAVPRELTQLDGALPRIARKVIAKASLTIVAIGSSSTAGAGASSEAATYPSRLAVELKERYPTVPITVINRGVNGEDAREMLGRFEKNVMAEKPDLVVWQVGTNSLLLDRPLDEAGALIDQGLERLKRDSIDVVLMDSQYAPKVLAKQHLPKLREIMSRISRRANVPTFQRFEVMRHWRASGIPFRSFLSPDELHMNDWSYACIARLLAHAIDEAVSRAALTAQAGAPHSQR